MKKRAILLIGVLFLIGCQAAFPVLKPTLEEEGEVYLYLQPFPQEAERLRFTLGAIYAIGLDGVEHPLSMISLPELKASELRRQRFLASGLLPPGSYVGLSFKVNQAMLKSAEGEASLLVPEAPVRIDFPFNVSRRQASVFSLILKYTESIPDGFSFNPVFTLFIPAKPVPSLVGYVTNYGSNNITVFDKKTGQVAAVIPTGRGPAGMSLDQKARRAYVALPEDDAIELIDVTSGEIVDRIRLNPGDHPQELALSPDGKVLLSINAGTNTASIIDPFSLIELTRINVENGPSSVLIDSTGKRAFVFNSLSSTVSVIDIPNQAILTTISTDPAPLRGQFNRKGDRLYIIHERSSYLTILDPASLTVLARAPVKMGMSSIKVDILTDLIYTGRRRDIRVEVYDPFTIVPFYSIRTGGGITYMTIDSEENNLYMVNPEMKRLEISNLVSRRVVSEIDVGEGPYWVTLMGER